MGGQAWQEKSSTIGPNRGAAAPPIGSRRPLARDSRMRLSKRRLHADWHPRRNGRRRKPRGRDPETVKKLVAQGHAVSVQAGAGLRASVTDEAYAAVGAQLVDAAAALGAEMVLKVRSPAPAELAQMKPGAVLVGMLEPFNAEGLQRLATAGVTGFALEAAPRTTRAQSMDVLSSQANIAGYKAVVMAADRYQKFFPMLMTAAGTVKAARVVILGVGVAGLQAIATAKRLGAVIEASDVRPSVKEQVESLGGKFIDVAYETAEEKKPPRAWAATPGPCRKAGSTGKGRGGQARGAGRRGDLHRADPRPRRAGADHRGHGQGMKPGSVIIDMAAGKGAQPGRQRGRQLPADGGRPTVTRHGVVIVGETNLAALVAADASSLYARNVLDFLKLVLPPAAKGEPASAFRIDLEDDIVAACLMAHQGAVTRKS
jgi:NAD(P) transhydrogenase subunit alpha